MRVLFVLDGLAGGGAERIVLTLAAEFTRRGHEATIVSLREERAYPIPSGVQLIPCLDPAPRRLRKIGEVRRRARLLDEALAELPSPDLVITSLLASDRIVAASRLAEAAWYRIPSILSAAMLEPVTGLKRARRVARLRNLYGGRRVIAISEGTARDLAERVGARPSRIEIIPNPFDATDIGRLSARPCELAGEDYVVSVARFNRVKRHDRLIGAFARARYEGRLVLLGDGPPEARRAIVDRVSELGLDGRVSLVGFHQNPYPFMRHARALVSASDSEGFGNVLVESLICGTPVVSTRCPYGPAEILTGDLEIGLADLSEESLAAALDRVLARPPDIQPEHYERFDLDTIADAYLDLAK